MKALDLFCGLGGWSDGLALEGFDVTGVEIEPKIAALYNHPVIICDICTLNPENFKGYDLIVGSPPCRDFSRISMGAGVRWKRPPDPWGEGLRLVNIFLDFIDKAKPTFWCMENSPYLSQYLNKKPRMVALIGKTMKRGFWGNFPNFLISRDMSKGILSGGRNRVTGVIRKESSKFSGPFRSWERARIPLPVARALGAAVKQSLEAQSEPCLTLLMKDRGGPR